MGPILFHVPSCWRTGSAPRRTGTDADGFVTMDSGLPVSCLCTAPKKLTAETFAQLLKKHHLPVRKAEQIEGGPYDSLPGCKSVCHYIPDNESASRALSRLSFDAGSRNVEVIDRLGIISVYFFPSQKKASMAWKTFSAAGGQADRAAAQVIFPY